MHTGHQPVSAAPRMPHAAADPRDTERWLRALWTAAETLSCLGFVLGISLAELFLSLPPAQILWRAMRQVLHY